MPDKPEDQYRFRFDGGLATNGEMNFYELSRSQYAAARLLYTLARYQETGRVVARLDERTIADIRVRAPGRGSYYYHAFVFVAAEASKIAVGIPLKALFTMVWDRVLSSASDYINLKAEGTLELKRIEQRAARGLSKEDTKRMEILREIQHDKEVTKREIVELARDLMSVNELRPDAPPERIQSFKAIADDLELEIRRENLMKPHAQALAAISDDDKRKLFSKSRPLIAEIGLPLRSQSADIFDMAVGRKHEVIGTMDAEKVAEIAETEQDEVMDQLMGQVIQYNRETGWGRFKLGEDESAANEYGRDISFRVLKPMQINMNSTIIDAMKEEAVVGEFMVTRDKEGKPKSLLLISLSERE